MPDVFIIGGGPAGATSARLLASWGWSVQVADGSTRAIARPSLAESLPPSTRKLLAFLGQLDVVDAAWKEMIKGGPFVILPWASRLNKFLGGVLPVKVRDAFLNLVGVYSSMEEFKGREEKK